MIYEVRKQIQTSSERIPLLRLQPYEGIRVFTARSINWNKDVK